MLSFDEQEQEHAHTTTSPRIMQGRTMVPVSEQAAAQQADEPTAASVLSQVGLPADVCHMRSEVTARKPVVCLSQEPHAVSVLNPCQH